MIVCIKLTSKVALYEFVNQIRESRVMNSLSFCFLKTNFGFIFNDADQFLNLSDFVW